MLINDGICFGFNNTFDLIEIDNIELIYNNQNYILNNRPNEFSNEKKFFDFLIIRILYYKYMDYMDEVNKNNLNNSNVKDKIENFNKMKNIILINLNEIYNFYKNECNCLSFAKKYDYFINKRVADKILRKYKVINYIHSYKDINRFFNLIKYFNYESTGKINRKKDEFNYFTNNFIHTFTYSFLNKKIPGDIDNKNDEERSKIFYALMKYYYVNNIHPMCNRVIRKFSSNIDIDNNGNIINNQSYYELICNKNGIFKIYNCKNKTEFNNSRTLYTEKLNNFRNYIRPNFTLDDFNKMNNLNKKNQYYIHESNKLSYNDIQVINSLTFSKSNISFEKYDEENKYDEEYFDYIRIYISYLSFNDENIRKLEESKIAVSNYVLNYISNNLDFKKFNISIKELKLDKIIYRRDGMIEFLFNFKDENRNNICYF